MTTNFESLPAALIRTISNFCDPKDSCSLSLVCRSIHRNLRISILKPPFSLWRRRVEYVTTTQQIMHIPTFISGQNYFVRLQLGFNYMQEWGPWTQFYVVAQPGTSDPDKRIQDDKGNEGTIVKQLPTTSLNSNFEDVFVEPHQNYFLWGRNKENTVIHLQLQARMILVSDTASFCFKQNFTKLKELESTTMQFWHPSEAKFLTFGHYQSPAPFVFTNLLSSALEAAESSTIQKYCGSPKESSTNIDLVQELNMFLKMCQQVMEQKRNEVCDPQTLLQKLTVTKPSVEMLPPIRIFEQTQGLISYQIFGNACLRIPVIPNTRNIRFVCQFTVPCSLMLIVPHLEEDKLAWAITPVKGKRSSVEFNLTPDHEAASCFLNVRPSQQGKYPIKKLELFLTVENKEISMTDLLSIVMEQFRTPLNDPKELNKLGSLHRLIHIFSGAVASVFLDSNGSDYEVITKFLDEEGFSTTSQGLRCLVDVICSIFWM